jgi:hypothetical protein
MLANMMLANRTMHASLSQHDASQQQDDVTVPTGGHRRRHHQGQRNLKRCSCTRGFG